MQTTFKRFIDDATRLTRQGDLAAATRAIRDALGGSSATDGTAPAPGPADRHRPHAPSGRKDDERAAGNGPTIVDGEWRRVSTAERAGRPIDTGTLSRGRHAGRARALDYRLFVPPLAPDATRPPLVVMLHGCTQSAEDFAVGTGMDALALEHGFLALYPEQSDRANPQRCWNWFKEQHQRRGHGEAGLLEGVIDEVVDTHDADPARVFVAGLSAGGAMATNLAALCPGRFRAVGVHSGLAAGSARDLPGALAAMRGGAPATASAAGDGAPVVPPTIVFHGDADRTVHPENGDRVVADCLAAARRTPGVELSAERREGETAGRRWTREVHRDGSDVVVAEHWRVHGAAHAWSGGDPRGSWADAAGPDASAEMVRFFLRTGAR